MSCVKCKFMVILFLLVAGLVQGGETQQELSAKQNELMAPIVQKAQETVTKIAKQGGYIYVFDMGTALYIDETQSTNITREARRALNISDDKTLEALAAQQQAQAQQ